MLNVSADLSVRSGHCFSLWICSFCSISLSLYLFLVPSRLRHIMLNLRLMAYVSICLSTATTTTTRGCAASLCLWTDPLYVRLTIDIGLVRHRLTTRTLNVDSIEVIKLIKRI